ncbi:protease inhibitor I42 family protein [Streptomyces echinatus]|uniref:Proteinase inhibitor I42 chagasin domain-containing protein n=1 Tax=Streptomyces echinatus TaxID=67293 RepID=A0A7W9PU96_9ACTN|nr:protease inhibitor I42 family protein [Streptomyces echinatus]MBB5927891.1 hypothetical protein [Streptomyces echinatus]
MTSRAALLAPAALSCLLALTGCGGHDGAGTPTPTGTPAATATAGGTATPGVTTRTGYGLDHRTVTLDPGERFSLTVPSSATLGERWYLAGPGPDPAVLGHRGDRTSGSGSDADGDTGGTQSFDFVTLAKGRTTVRLLRCPLNTCTGPGTASPYPTMTAVPPAHADAAFSIFSITVH